MGNLTLPTPVALAGGAICVLGGYLIGAIAGPDTASRTTATVASYDASTGRLCLSGGGIDGQEGAVEDGRLCGTWRRSAAARTPRAGDQFRFVSLTTGTAAGSGADQRSTTVIYGDVVP